MAALETIILDIPGVSSGCFGNVCCRISFVLIFFLFVCLFDNDYLHSSPTQFNVHNKNHLMDVYFCRISRIWYKCSLYETDILLWKRAFTSMQRDDFSLYSLTLYTL